MEPHVGEVVNLEHFFSVLSLKMFCRYSIDHEFPDSGKKKKSASPHTYAHVRFNQLSIHPSMHQPPTPTHRRVVPTY
jgi:hypothetical protein